MTKIYPTDIHKKEDYTYNIMYGIICGSCICIIIMILIIFLIIINKEQDGSNFK